MAVAEVLNVLEDQWRARDLFDPSLVPVDQGSDLGFDNDHQALLLNKDWLRDYFAFVDSGSSPFAEQVLLPQLARCAESADRTLCQEDVLVGFITSAFVSLDGESARSFFGQFSAAFPDIATLSPESLSRLVEVVLKSPQFLFVELAGDQAQLTLAQRLSLFLWRSSPDEQLLDAARTGRLGETGEVQREVDRMIEDPKHLRLLGALFERWFGYADLSSLQVDTQYYAALSEPLKRAMVKESELLFRDILTNRRPLVDLLTARQTYVNGVLAAHYGIDAALGEEFVEVSTAGSKRRGFLTHATFLAHTSNPTFSSPVRRGLYVLDKLLCSEPPAPPADVQTELEMADGPRQLSVKEAIKAHSSNPRCAACHAQMDAIGIAFEHFNPAGLFRERYEVQNQPVDASGTWGEQPFRDHLQLIDYLAVDERYVECMMEVLYGFALNRQLAAEEVRALRPIAAALPAESLKMSDLIHRVVQDPNFLAR